MVDYVKKFEKENEELLAKQFREILERNSKGYYGDCVLTKSIDYIVNKLVKVAL